MNVNLFTPLFTDYCDFKIISCDAYSARPDSVSSAHNRLSDGSYNSINHSKYDCSQGRHSDRSIKDLSVENIADCSDDGKNIKLIEPSNIKDSGCRYSDSSDGGNVGDDDSSEDDCSHGSHRDRGRLVRRDGGSRSRSDRTTRGCGELRLGNSYSRRNAGRTHESYIATDSDEDGGFDLVNTLRHYRRGRGMSSSSSSCDCESCASGSDAGSFFSDEEGPPGGETTLQRRVAVWLEAAKY